MQKTNIPEVKLGVVMSSRNNFADELAVNAEKEIQTYLEKAQVNAYLCPAMTIRDGNVPGILNLLNEEKCNALVVVLGNFGAETPETMLAEKFQGPVMFMGIAEDGDARMYDGRRDCFCGMLNCSYNLGLRGKKAYIPAYPVGTAKEVAENIERFLLIARALVGLANLKIVTFGPRPNDFVACNAPIKGFYDLGVEIQENSELDLYLAFQKHKDDPRIPQLVEEMLVETNQTKYGDTLPAMAQYELTLRDWAEDIHAEGKFVAFANKCWPAFQQAFGFLPCYIHGRLASTGIPVGCEVDAYGAMSEYIGLCICQEPVTIMDLNNAIPDDIYQKILNMGYQCRPKELFMVYHCGNAGSCMMVNPVMKYKLNRKDPYAPETGEELTRGTFEGRMKEGEATLFRLHGNPDASLQAYVVKGEIIPVDVNTYGNYAVLKVNDMERFYRYVLLEKHYPHHAALAYGDYAGVIYDVLDYLGVADIGYNQPAGIPYAHENPFNPKW